MWYTMNVEKVFRELRTNQKSRLTEEKAKQRIAKYGLNSIKEKKKENIFVRFLKQFKDFMIMILIIASIVSAVVAYLGGSGDYIDSVIIIVIVIFNAIMGLVQEEKAEKSLEALKKLSAPIAKVRRDGRIKEIDSNQLVPGDIVILEAGNYIPADCRLFSVNNLKVEESSLTGENLPVLKNAEITLKDKTTLADQINMVFS